LILGAAYFQKTKETRPKAKEMPQKGDPVKEGRFYGGAWKRLLGCACIFSDGHLVKKQEWRWAPGI